MSQKDSHDVSTLEEFKALRDEVKQNETQGLQLILFLLTTTLAVFGLVEKEWIPKWLVPIAIQSSLIVGLTMYYSALILRLRLSTYIQVFIEPNVSGLNWETRNSLFSDKRNDNKSWLYKTKYWMYKWFFNVFSILTFIGIGISFKTLMEMHKNCNSNFLWVLVTLLILHLATISLWSMCIKCTGRHGEFISFWQSIKDESKL